jgi:hypothetical protein
VDRRKVRERVREVLSREKLRVMELEEFMDMVVRESKCNEYIVDLDPGEIISEIEKSVGEMEMVIRVERGFDQLICDGVKINITFKRVSIIITTPDYTYNYIIPLP